MSMILTIHGWKTLRPTDCQEPGHTPSLLERMGVSTSHDPVKAMADYANGKGRGVYFTYRPDGTAYQSKGAINPLKGMFAEKAEG